MGSDIEFVHPLPKASLVGDRSEWVLEQASGKKVLDVGCVDAGQTMERYKKGDMLHARLEKTCSGLIGVDVDQDGIAAMRQLGFTNLLAVDVSESSLQVIEAVKNMMGGCDIILCGEILEHILNMGNFLTGIREIAKAFTAVLIVTVPNAFSIRALPGIVRGVEYGHPDHKHVFSPLSLKTTLDQTGFSVQKTLFYSNWRVPNTRLKKSLLAACNTSIFRWRPPLAEGLIMIAKAK